MNAAAFRFFKKSFNRQRAVLETKTRVTVEVHSLTWVCPLLILFMDWLIPILLPP